MFTNAGRFTLWTTRQATRPPSCTVPSLFSRTSESDLIVSSTKFREKLPRVYELRDLIDDPAAPCAYFQRFDEKLRDEPSMMNVWLTRERDLERLDPKAWSFLKHEARPYLTARDKRGRGWHQLIAILNQARAYNFLIDEGCTAVRFIPRSNVQEQMTPDIQAEQKNRTVACEVKTIELSDAEIESRQPAHGGRTLGSLEEGFFKKLTSVLVTAKKQMESFDSSPYARRVAFVVVNFDEPHGEYKVNYFAQIDQYLGTHPVAGIEVVLYNERTPFHCPVTIRNATVVNE